MKLIKAVCTADHGNKSIHIRIDGTHSDVLIGYEEMFQNKALTLAED